MWGYYYLYNLPINWNYHWSGINCCIPLFLQGAEISSYRVQDNAENHVEKGLSCKLIHSPFCGFGHGKSIALRNSSWYILLSFSSSENFLHIYGLLILAHSATFSILLKLFHAIPVLSAKLNASSYIPLICSATFFIFLKLFSHFLLQQ